MQPIKLSAKRSGNLEINSIDFHNNIGSTQNQDILGFKVDYILKLKYETEKKDLILQADFDVSFALNFHIKNSEIKFTESDLSDLGEWSMLAIHQLRECIFQI